jgi:ATP-dependent RNA helicase RhlE
LVQRVFAVTHARKAALLTALLQHPSLTSVIVFVKRKRDADGLARQISRSGRAAASIHSDRTQKERIAALDAFRRGECPVLVATDVAARGIDVDGISHVVHFDVPRSSEDYIHRSGRTARAGAVGQVMTFVAPDEEEDVAMIEKEIGKRIPRFSLKNFDAGVSGRRPKGRGDEGQRPARTRAAPRSRKTSGSDRP